MPVAIACTERTGTEAKSTAIRACCLITSNHQHVHRHQKLPINSIHFVYTSLRLFNLCILSYMSKWQYQSSHDMEGRTYRRPDRSMSHIAKTMQGSMSKHVTPLAIIEADSPSIPMFANKSPAPDCMRICGVKYSTALIPENCNICLISVSSSIQTT